MIGADVGGTSTRFVVADITGRVLAGAEGGPGSPVGVGLDVAAGEIRSVAERALRAASGVSTAGEETGATTPRVVGYVLGLAGGSQAKGNPRFAAAISPAGVGVSPQLVSDPAVAFCSASPEPSGYVLIGGTGAVAARVDGEDVTAWSDGMGWLLGDDGSGFWLGREAVRRTALALQSGAALTPLNRAVVELAGVADYAGLVARCYAERPTALGRYAPLVSAQAADSPDAAELIDSAADSLAATLLALDPEPGLPIVLAGSLLVRPTPIAAAVRARLAGRPNPTLTATQGALGACWLALRSLGVTDPAVHARLIESSGSEREPTDGSASVG